MAEVYPFRGWRYNPQQVGDLTQVTAPPYDVIDADEQDELYKRHPCNVIRLILNRDEPGDDNPDARYERAAGFFKQWREEGVLTQEPEDALYVYHQVFDWEGQHFVRKGFLGRIQLEQFGEGSVFPHEQTLSGPKEDRFKLMKTCRANLSPVFGLFPDPETKVQEPLEEAVGGAAPLEATDEDGVIHRFWPVTDKEAVNRVHELMREKPIFIADGHHRYETSLNYRDWLKSEGRHKGDDDPANCTLMMFVGMSDPGLAILPTHRLVSGLPDLTTEQLQEALSANFEIRPMGQGAEAAHKTWAAMQEDGGQDVFGFGTTADGQWVLAKVTDASPMEKLAPEQSDAWRSLGVSLLHKLVLDHLLAGTFSGAEPSCRYVHKVDEVLTGQKQDGFQLGCLVQPASIDHVKAIATAYEKMPPKSTYFYPKLISGLVFNPLE